MTLWHLLFALGIDPDHQQPEKPGLAAAYETLRIPLSQFILRMTGDPEETLDMMHETFARALAGKKTPPDSPGWRRYLFRIAVNLCRDRARHRRIMRTESFEELEAKRGPLPGPDRMPGSQLELHQAEDFARAFIDSLPVKEKAVLLMKKTQGMSYEEIRIVMNSSLRTVKRQAKNAIIKLTEAMEAAGFFGGGGR